MGDIDNSVRDETIMNWVDPPAAPPAPIRYHDKQRQWAAQTWPFAYGGLDSGLSHNAIDTGEDDNEVLDGFGSA